MNTHVKRRTLVLGLALAGMTGGVAYRAASIAAAGADDWARLRVMPLSAAIRAGLRHDELQPETARPSDAAPDATKAEAWSLPVISEESISRIENAPTSLRTLAWLGYLADQPLSDGSDGSNGDGLHKFFYLWDGQVAPQVANALREAGFAEKAAIFTEAMAMFGTPYSTSDAGRADHFAWNGPRERISETESIVPDLNAFDKQMMALGRQFGPMYRLWPGIQTWALGTPALAPWLDAARAAMTDEERMHWLLSQLRLRIGPVAAELADAPDPYATLYAVNLFNAEMLNGSVVQFFFNNSGDIAPEVAEALHTIGLDRHAAAVRSGMALCAPYSRDRATRLKASKTKPGLVGALDDLTPIVDDGAIGPAMLAYASSTDLLPR